LESRIRESYSYKLQVELLKISLKEAKNNTDALLNNNVTLDIEDEKNALVFSTG